MGHLYQLRDGIRLDKSVEYQRNIEHQAKKLPTLWPAKNAGSNNHNRTPHRATSRFTPHFSA